MSYALRLFPVFCLALAALSVLADMNAVMSAFIWGVADGFDVTRPMGFQAAMLLMRAIIQSLQWVAYAALAELLIRHLYALGAFKPRPLSLKTAER